MSVLAALTQAAGFFPALFITAGLVAGVWIDWLLRKLDGSRARERVAVGRGFVSLADTVAQRQEGFHSEWPANVHDIRPMLMSTFIKVEGFGIWAPVDQLYTRNDGAAILVNYLRIVGTMLRDGHFKQARKRALEAKRFIEQA